MQITRWFPALNRPFQLFWEKDWLSPARVSSKISTAPKRSGSFWISFQISLYSVITRERSCRSMIWVSSRMDSSRLALNTRPRPDPSTR